MRESYVIKESSLNKEESIFFYIFENVCKKLDLYYIRFDIVILVSYILVNVGYWFLDG